MTFYLKFFHTVKFHPSKNICKKKHGFVVFFLPKIKVHFNNFLNRFFASNIKLKWSCEKFDIWVEKICNVWNIDFSV